jgi:hypothetical protein
MHSQTQRVRFATWIGIASLIILGSGLYFWSREEYETKAGTTTNAPEASNTRASTGLASHWTFDREHISGTSITDRVGSNTGTSSGSPTPTIGKFGQALDFDGSDDHINVTSAASLDIDATEDFSLAGWFNRDLFAADHTIVAKRNGQADTDDGYVVYIDDSTDQLVFEVSDTGDTDEYSVASTATFTVSGWHHFVAVWDQDSATGTEVYIDGVANGTDTGTIADVGDLTEAIAFRIGSETDGGNRFDGKLDDIRFYSTALSASDAYQLYTSGNATVNAPIEDPLSQSLLGYWKMDDGTGTNATDASGNGNTLTMTGSPTWTAPGQIGASTLDFSGTAQYLSVADPASNILDFGVDGASFTITGWFNRDTFANDHTLVAKKLSQSTTSDDGYIAWIGGGDDLFHFRVDEAGSTDTYSIASASAFTATGWHSFAISWNDNSSLTTPVNLYIDGTLSSGTTSGTFANVGTFANNEAFALGAESDGGNPFDGKIDDIRIYNRALSTDEVSKLYQTTAPAQPVDTSLVNYWTFDRSDTVGTTAIDRGRKGLNGTTTGTTKTIGKVGQGLSFNGTSDSISLVSTPISDFSQPNSVCLWLKTTDITYSQGGFSQSAVDFMVDTDNYIRIGNDEAFGSGSGGAVYVGYKTGGVSHTTETTARVLSNNVWAHVCSVYNASVIAIYIDGTLRTDAFTGSTFSTSDANYIGKRGSGGTTGSWYGSLDDIRIYNRALSASEVSQLYTSGNTTVNTPAEDPLSQSLLGYWKLDEGTGTSTTADSSGNATTLTMTNVDSGDWQTGRIGPWMLDLDGAANPNSEYLTVADPASGILDFADGASFSITGWFNRDTFTTDDTLIAKRVGVASGNTGYAAWIDATNDVLNFEVTDGTDEYSRASTTASAFTATGWHQFAAVFNDTVGMSIYIDGTTNQQTASGTIGNIGSLANAEAFRIGVLSDASTTSPFDGKLDDIRVYGYPLSAGDVSKLYQTTAPAQPVDTGLVGHWTFDGLDIKGTTVIDRSGKGNNGTATGTTKTIGKLGQGLSFNGTSDALVLPNFTLTASSKYTWSAWVKPSANNTAGFWSFTNDNGTFLIIYAETGVGTNLIDANWKTPGVSLETLSSSNVIANNQFFLVTVTYDGSLALANRFVIYANGVNVTSGSIVDGTIGNVSSTDTRIGSDGNFSTFFPGVIDDARFYNRALSATEVADLYNMGK